MEIAADVAAYDHVNTNYWFYGHGEIASVTGMGSLRGVCEMQHTFNSCDGLREIDLSGLDPSSLEDLVYAFGRCGSLVGGAGTTYASSYAGYQYMRIDGADYLTAKV